MNNFIDEFQRLQVIEIEIEKLTGYNLEELRTLFAQGYTLKEPVHPVFLDKFAEVE